MNTIKKALGFVWITIGLAAIVLLVYSAIRNIGHAKDDIGKPMPWIIIIAIFTPIAIGLIMFGRYALKGEFSKP